MGRRIANGALPHSPGAAKGLPTLPLTAMVALVLASVAGTAAVRWSGPPAGADKPAAVVAERRLRFADRSDGGVDVIDATNPQRRQVLLPGEDGFLRATLRTLARERKRQGVGAEPPFTLSQLADGRLLLQDDTIRRRVDLEAFGPSNAQRFARLLGTPATAATAVAAAKP